MILADKITELRRKQGWSQEQLAEKLGVSRQSVSKWESAMSIPDMDKIIKMSNIFSVSTDYLLKDNIEQLPAAVQDTADTDYYVSVETANTYLDTVGRTAGKFAMAVTLLVLCPIPVILLGALSEYSLSGTAVISESMAGGLGVAILLICVAVAVTLLILNSMKLDKYEYMEKEDLTLDFGLKGIVEEKYNDYRKPHRTAVATGVALCICAVVPLMLVVALELSDFTACCAVCILLVCVALGVYCLVYTANINDAYKKLLQIDDYTPKKKRLGKKLSFLAPVYWCTVTAVYLYISFTSTGWDKSWVVLPVAGIMFPVIYTVAEVAVTSFEKDR